MKNKAKDWAEKELKDVNLHTTAEELLQGWSGYHISNDGVVKKLTRQEFETIYWSEVGCLAKTEYLSREEIIKKYNSCL